MREPTDPLVPSHSLSGKLAAVAEGFQLSQSLIASAEALDLLGTRHDQTAENLGTNMDVIAHFRPSCGNE